MYFFKEWLPGSCTQSPQMAMIGSFGQVLDPLEDEPLSSRGWTLQERLLPSRVVHYAKDQIYFQCDCTVQSEDGFKLPNKFFNLDLLIDTHMIPFKDHGVTEDSMSFIPGHQPTPQNYGRWDGGWLSLIQNYSLRELTKRPDKLPALSGLARMLAKATGDRYLAGLWARHIPEDLFWRVYPWEESFEGETPVKGKLLGRVTRLEEYRAPSWSWASLDAPVQFLPLTYKSLVCRIISCSTTPSGVDEYGKVKAGKLVMEGPIYEIFPRARRDNEWATHGEPVEIRFLPGDNRGISLGHMYLDHRDEPLPPNFYALFLDSGNALVLRPRPSPSASQLDEPLRKVLERELDRMPEAILTTNDIIEQIQQRPETKTWVFQAVANAERIGLATFTNSGENKKKPRRDEPYPDLNGLRLEDIEMTQSGESWGMITAEDPKVRVTIL
ncbi:hypothetical protein ACET3X_009391 [Alternaria dauci]|uniref:Uncharacterized protein n=1 Tax=Alternaria dauci TaxID=48095 RepID=A0ABR3UAI8_9PLEO